MTAKSPITTHVLDTSLGKPGAGVPVRLEILVDESWHELARKETDADGRAPGLLEAGALKAATYRMTFDTARYFKARGAKTFYPYVQVVFEIATPGDHYHVPLLVSPYGYSTYRGS